MIEFLTCWFIEVKSTMTARVQVYSENDAADETDVSPEKAKEAWDQAAKDSEHSVTTYKQARKVLLS